MNDLQKARLGVFLFKWGVLIGVQSFDSSKAYTKRRQYFITEGMSEEEAHEQVLVENRNDLDRSVENVKAIFRPKVS